MSSTQSGPSAANVAAVLGHVRELLADSQVLSAEMALRALLRQAPHSIDAWLYLADIADARDDGALARECLANARGQAPTDAGLAMHLAQTHLRADRLDEAMAELSLLLAREPGDYAAWFALGEVLERAGRIDDAARARFQGVHRGRAAGHLTTMANTPPAWQPRIEYILGHVDHASSAVITDGLALMRERFGADDMKRVAHAMAVHRGEAVDRPANPNQAPKFLYFPGLPEGPYHDPHLHAWTQGLVDAFDGIRDEALDVLSGGGTLESFLQFKPGQSKAGYLGGAGRNPSWDAFFFYRHGQAYGANQARCPKTSAALANAELCHVDGQAPEICFSVLQPGSHIMPHHGVTNTRLVLHLPLIVPEGCALKVHGGGEHVWREGEPMMFDDTYLHEAWNTSDQPRVILLMDCWNPHLTPAERTATKHLIDGISRFENLAVSELIA